MALITFSGEVSEGPELQQSDFPYGTVACFTVVERTGKYAKGDWIEHRTPTIRYVRTDVQSAERVAETLQQGSRVMVTGHEYTAERTVDGVVKDVRVVESIRVGVLIAPEQSIIVVPNESSGGWWPSPD